MQFTALTPEQINLVQNVAGGVDALRRGNRVQVEDVGGRPAFEVQTAEPMDGALPMGRGWSLLISGQRAQVLGLPEHSALLALPQTTDEVLDLISAAPSPSLAAWVANAEPTKEPDLTQAALQLAKLARLLPAAFVRPLSKKDDTIMPVTVTAQDILSYRDVLEGSFAPVSRAPLPTSWSTDGELVVFQPFDRSVEHVALITKDALSQASPLVRLHSSCFTGDLLTSLRCDCGPQLNGAMEQMAQQGGILLYLNQEGRGIGLANKMRAYELQYGGMDTLDANQALGFHVDERRFKLAAVMLAALGIDSCQLMTNNPNKVQGLTDHGIQVSNRIPLVLGKTAENQAYFDAKSSRMGHIFEE